MKHSLDIRLMAPDRAILDNVRSVLPPKSDQKVWGEQYNLSDVYRDVVTDSDDWILRANIRLKDSKDRGDIKVLIENQKDIGSLLRSGSYIRLHTCYHDGETPKPCEVTDLIKIGTL